RACSGTSCGRTGLRPGSRADRPVATPKGDRHRVCGSGRSEIHRGDFPEGPMADNPTAEAASQTVSRERLVELLNEDLAREYQAIIAYVVYSQVLKGAQYMTIAEELVKHARQELEHALTIAKQVDYLGGMPVVTPRPVKTSAQAEEM